MSLDILPLHHGKAQSHAVKLIAFFMELDGPIGQEELNKLDDLFERAIAPKLPMKRNISAVNINLHDNGRAQRQPDILGRQFGRIAQNGEPEQLFEMKRDQISYADFAYTHFDICLGQALVWFKLVIENVLPENFNVARIGIQYIDEFIPKEGSVSWNRSHLINMETKFLPINVVNATNYWHSSNGFFEEHEGNLILHSINISNNPQIEKNNELLVVMDLSHRIDFSEPLGGDPAAIVATIERLYRQLKQKHNEMLKDILSEEMKNLIGLVDKK